MSQAWVTFDKAEMDLDLEPRRDPGGDDGPGRRRDPRTGRGKGARTRRSRNWAAAAKAWGHPFLFAPWWEMNGGWYAWGRDPHFVAAWRRFHDLVVAEGATNVTWTWVAEQHLVRPALGPGALLPRRRLRGLDRDRRLQLGTQPGPARQVDDPRPDAHADPASGSGKSRRASRSLIVENASSELGGNKAEWIAEMLGTYLPHHPEIKGYMWFNWNFEKANGFRADWPIETSAPAQQAFRRGIQSSLYRSARPSMPNLTKVPAPPALSGGDGPHVGRPLGRRAGRARAAGGGRAGRDRHRRLERAGRRRLRRVRAADRAGRDCGARSSSSPHPASSESEDALSPQVAVAPDGTATVVWIRSDGANFVVQARRIAPDGTLGANPGPLGHRPGRGGAPGRGRARRRRHRGLEALQRHPIPDQRAPDRRRRHARATQDLSATGRDAVDPQVAVAADGTATAVWSRYDGANSIVQERRVAPDGTPGGRRQRPLLRRAERGAAAGRRRPGRDGDRGLGPLQRRPTRSCRSAGSPPDGVPEPTTNDLSATGRDAAEAQLALGPDGSATVVWERFDGSAFVVQSRRVDPAGSPVASTRTLSAPGRDAAEPQVSVAPDGSATVVWSRFDGLNFIVQRRGLAADGTPAAATDSLSAAGHGAAAPQVASRARAVVWTRFDGARDIVQGVNPAIAEVPKACSPRHRRISARCSSAPDRPPRGASSSSTPGARP